MPWLERIDQINNRLTPIAIAEDGNRTPALLKHMRALLPARTTEALANVQGLALDSLERVDAVEYLQAVGMPHADPAGHEVYTFSYNGRRILVPAAVLLLNLVGQMHLFGLAPVLPDTAYSQCSECPV